MSLYIEGLNIWTKNCHFDSFFLLDHIIFFLTKKNGTNFAFLTSKIEKHNFISNKEKISKFAYAHSCIYNNIKIYIFLVLLDKERKFDKERSSIEKSQVWYVFSC